MGVESGQMKEGEKLFLIDDDTRIRQLLAQILGRGHKVVAEAVSFWAVKEAIEAGLPEEPTIAIVDDKMPKEGDGKLVADFLRVKFPKIKIVSFSGDLQSYGDINLKKSVSPLKLIDAIASF
jgi:DNA-binding NtrC family response regulator